jgi:hypothetical protein
MRPFTVAELPQPKELKSISPSRFAAMGACLLKESCSSGRRTGLLPNSPRSFLGTTAHKVIEMAARGRLLQMNKTAEDLWNELLADQEKRLMSDLVHKHLVPFRKSCPDFYLIKARALQAAVKLAAQTRPTPTADGEARSIGHEIEVESRDKTVRGFVDAVTYINGQLSLTDYKTGAIVRECDGVSMIKSEYETQLKLYAALYHETFSRWPERLFVVGMHGQTFEIAVERDECIELLEVAKAAFIDANRRIRTALADQTPSSLACPSPSACKFCHIRPACTAYCAQRAAADDLEWPLDLWGTIESQNWTPTGSAALRVTDASVPGGTAVVRRLSTQRFAGLRQQQLGRRIAAYGLRKEANSHTYCESPMTSIFMLEGEESGAD